MKTREMNDRSGRRPGGRRTWTRWAAAVTATALAGLLAIACGDGASHADPVTGGPTRADAALAYARCMRSHGVTDFPDPNSDGNFDLPTSSVSSQEAAANRACNHLLNVGTQLNAAQTQHTLDQLLKYAKCMRSHGVPEFPDPETTTGGIGMPGGFTFPTAGRNLHQKSPRYQAAARACQSLATHAKG